MSEFRTAAVMFAVPFVLMLAGDIVTVIELGVLVMLSEEVLTICGLAAVAVAVIVTVPDAAPA